MGERVPLGARVGKAHVGQLDGGRAGRGGGRLRRAVGLGGDGLEDLVDAAGARGGLGEHGDEVRELEELYEGLADVAHEGHELALGEAADVNLQAAHPQQGDEAAVDDGVGERVHDAGDVSRGDLHVADVAGHAREHGLLGALLAEGAQDARALEVLARLEQDLVEALLDLAVADGGDAHEREDEAHRHERGGQKARRLPAVDEEGRDDRAHDDERDAQDEAEEQVEAVLGLLGVVGDARDYGGAPQRVDVLARQAEHVTEQRVSHARAEVTCQLGRVVLGDDGHDVADQAYGGQDGTMRDDEGRVPLGYAHVDDLRHDEGRYELEDGLQPLERRREHALEVVPAQESPELEQLSSLVLGPPLA